MDDLLNIKKLPDEELRMWCIEQLTHLYLITPACSSQTLCESAQELFNYIREGVPYEANWIKQETSE